MCFDLGFDQRLDLLDDDQLIALLRKFAYQIERHRAGKPELEYWRLGETLAYVHVSWAGGNESDTPIRPGLNRIEFRHRGFGAQRILALEH